MPELPEVETVRRFLAPAMEGARFDAVLLRRANLRIPFPAEFDTRLVGHRVVAVTRRAKYLLIEVSTGDTLIVHLGMSGWFRVEAATGPEFETAGDTDDDPEHDHVVFRMSSGIVVTFNDPRRFGLMDLATRDELPMHTALKGLGPEPLSAAFSAAALARACSGRKVPLKVALLDQRVVAGVGNIYASEALFEARLSPKRRAGILATRSAAPTAAARTLAPAVVKVLTRAIERLATNRFKVYDRAGEPCPRRGCGGTIRRIVQAGRSTFFCPACQK